MHVSPVAALDAPGVADNIDLSRDVLPLPVPTEDDFVLDILPFQPFQVSIIYHAANYTIMRLKAALASHQAQAKRHALEAKSKERIAAQKSAKAGPGKKARPASTSSSVTPATLKAASKASAASAPSNIPANPATELSESIASPAKRTKPTIPFDKLDTILLLGEANFSFARSLLAPPHNLSGHMICATSFDTQEVCFKKYSDAEDNVKVLKEGGVRVLFGVDAGDLPGSVVGKGKDRDREARESKDGRDMGYAGRKEHLRKDQGGRWSRVIFNFPHAGEFVSLLYWAVCGCEMDVWLG